MNQEPVKPWLSKTDSIISFLCDDGALYCSQHHSLSAVSPEPHRLEIKAPPNGTIIVTGPAARELCACLCGGRATMIRNDGEDIRGVSFLPDPVEL
jgi:hypothetical protein